MDESAVPDCGQCQRELLRPTQLPDLAREVEEADGEQGAKVGEWGEHGRGEGGDRAIGKSLVHVPMQEADFGMSCCSL